MSERCVTATRVQRVSVRASIAKVPIRCTSTLVLLHDHVSMSMTRIACCQDWSSWQTSRKNNRTPDQVTPSRSTTGVIKNSSWGSFSRHFQQSHSLRVYHLSTSVTQNRKPVLHVYESAFQPDNVAAYQTASSCWVCSFALI
jgi:hypothetical protein